MTVRILSTTALVAVLSIAPMGAAFSQDAAVRGEITQIFDGRVLLQTDDGAILVQLPEDVDGDSLEPGQRFAVEGDRIGSDMVATAMRLQPERDGAEDSANDGSQASDTPDLPDALSGLDLRDLRVERDDDETKYRARLDGMKFEAEYGADGRLEEVKTERAGTLPDQLVARLLSEGLRSAISDLGFARLLRDRARNRQDRGQGHDAEAAPPRPNSPSPACCWSSSARMMDQNASRPADEAWPRRAARYRARCGLYRYQQGQDKGQPRRSECHQPR